jgi:hypothetical protein
MLGVAAALVIHLLPFETAAAGPLGFQEEGEQVGEPAPEYEMTPPVEVPAEAPAEIPTLTPTAIPTATPTPSPTAVPIDHPTAIQKVIQRSNDEQVQAIATRNVSLIADTLTDDHVQELSSILQDMLNHRVTGIALLKLDWGPIVVAPDGTRAVATTYETWRVVSQEGTVDDAPQRNDYTLVFDNATWKIKSNVQVMVPPPPAP